MLPDDTKLDSNERPGMKASTGKILSRARRIVAAACLNPVRLLVAAAIFHLALTIAIYVLGHYQFFPATFDENGIGISFALDGVQHRADAARLSEVLAHGHVLDWLTATYPLHVKLYSMCFAIFGRVLGLSIISVEPVNAFCYLMILTLVFKLGQETFNRRVGLLAATSVALWPSFLLHSTQLLKDPLFIAGMLALMLILLRWLTRTYSWLEALLTGAIGGLITAGLWLARDSMGAIVIATVLLGAVMLISQQFSRRRVQLTNLVGMALLIAITITAQQVLPDSRKHSYYPTSIEATNKPQISPAHDVGASAPATYTETTTPSSGIVASITRARARFIMRYRDAGSNIDSSVQLTSTADLARYLPRAAVVGFFAPFPEMWFVAGKEVGLMGRLLAGLETFVMYAVEALALFGLWRGRRRLPVWLLLSVAVMGMLALGLVVVNVGALFRLRYVFLILLIILCAEGVSTLRPNSKSAILICEP